MNIDKELDTRGLNCPLPILKAKKALSDMESGQILRVMATDAGSVRDFQAFARQTGNELVEQQTTAIFISDSYDCVVDALGSFVLYAKGRADLLGTSLGREQEKATA